MAAINDLIAKIEDEDLRNVDSLFYLSRCIE